jgi:hypothetical protein
MTRGKVPITAKPSKPVHGGETRKPITTPTMPRKRKWHPSTKGTSNQDQAGRTPTELALAASAQEASITPPTASPRAGKPTACVGIGPRNNAAQGVYQTITN